MILNPVIFREYDIRGIYETEFDLDFAYNLGKAVGTLAKVKQNNDDLNFALGYDARHSSPHIANQLSKGLREVGITVNYMGLVTSPMTYFTTFESGMDGAIMVTGSHNPPEYNGFKISIGPSTLHGDDIQTLYKIIKDKAYTLSEAAKELPLSINEAYITKYKKEFSDLSGIPVVFDCANAAAGAILRPVLEALNIDATILFEKPDGDFPNHHPDPTVEENLVDLKKTVLEKKALVGIGFDGDADRIAIVDEKAQALLGDELMSIYAESVLEKNPGAKIIGDVKCSDRMYNRISELGGQPIMWKTGHSLVKQKIKDEKAPFGGELSGHIFFADRANGYDDAIYCALRLIEILKEKKCSTSSLLKLTTAHNTPEIRLDTTEEKKHSIVAAVKKAYSSHSDNYKANLIDGIRLSFKNGWALIRASNTQPVLSLRFEADTPEKLEEIQSEIMTHIDSLL